MLCEGVRCCDPLSSMSEAEGKEFLNDNDVRIQAFETKRIQLHSAGSILVKMPSASQSRASGGEKKYHNAMARASPAKWHRLTTGTMKGTP